MLNQQLEGKSQSCVKISKQGYCQRNSGCNKTSLTYKVVIPQREDTTDQNIKAEREVSC